MVEKISYCSLEKVTNSCVITMSTKSSINDVLPRSCINTKDQGNLLRTRKQPTQDQGPESERKRAMPILLILYAAGLAGSVELETAVCGVESPVSLVLGLTVVTDAGRLPRLIKSFEVKDINALGEQPTDTLLEEGLGVGGAGDSSTIVSTAVCPSTQLASV
jgi:hypothetical protein